MKINPRSFGGGNKFVQTGANLFALFGENLESNKFHKRHLRQFDFMVSKQEPHTTAHRHCRHCRAVACRRPCCRLPLPLPCSCCWGLQLLLCFFDPCCQLNWYWLLMSDLPNVYSNLQRHSSMGIYPPLFDSPSGVGNSILRHNTTIQQTHLD